MTLERMFTVKRTIAALMVCGTMVLTACAPATQTPAATSTGDRSSPLDEYLGGDEDEQSDTERAAKERAVQEKIAACMKAQGFEYVPVDRPVMPEGMAIRPLGDRTWTEKYGYGISTTQTVSASETEKDPNAAIRDAMTESERKAYEDALVGPRTADGGGKNSGPVPDGPGMVVGGPQGAIAFTAGGCAGTAREDVYGKQAQFDMSEFKDLFDALGKLRGTAESDPRIAPLIKEWAGCLADHGYPGYTNPDDPQDAIMKRWADLNGWKFDKTDDGGTTMTIDGPSGEAKKPDPTKAAALRKDEIAVALVDFGCRQPYQATVDQVRLELEKQFVADHKAELERYRDAMNGVN